VSKPIRKEVNKKTAQEVNDDHKKEKRGQAIYKKKTNWSEGLEGNKQLNAKYWDH